MYYTGFVMRYLLILVMVLSGCAAQQQAVKTRTMPDLKPYEPDVPAEPKRPDHGVQTTAVDMCTDGQGQQVGGGVLFSDETAGYVGRLRVGYDELRQLYLIEARTHERERQIYEAALRDADDEVQRQAEKAKRTFWEQHAGTIGMVGGVVVGVAATVGVLAVTQKVQSP